MDTVLFIRTHSSQKPVYQERLTGVYQFAQEKGWRVQTIDLPPPEQIHSLVAFWKPIGCIVESGSWGNQYPQKLFGRTPLVYLDRDPTTIRNAFCIAHDPAATTELAARELLSLGLEHFAFVPNFRPVSWSESREKAFRGILKTNGKEAIVFRSPERGDTPKWREDLRTWIGALPKPCAVMSANDPVGEAVLSAAAEGGISVPDEIAVIGVDNAEIICENAKPPLSSVALNYIEAGYLSAALLAERISRPRMKPVCRYYSPTTIVRRASTRRFNYRDGRVVKAMKLISNEACGHLTVARVVETMGCTRRLAEIRFRDLVGMSILEAIQDVRLNHACLLLRTTTSTTNAIANTCGYSKDIFLQKLFRRKFGKSMTEFRKGR